MTRRDSPPPGCCRCGSPASVKPRRGRYVCTNAHACRQRIARHQLKQRRQL